MKKPNGLWLKCQPCNYTWLAAYLPMETSRLRFLLAGVCCPLCGGRAGIELARELAIVHDEPRTMPAPQSLAGAA